MKNIYFYSDPHFGHKNVIKYDNRPFKDIQDMNNKLIDKYNKVVKNDDLVIWVGDCFFTRMDSAQNIMNSLNGTKVLVRGNHDKGTNKFYRLGFDLVCDEMQLKIDGKKVIIKHYPYNPNFWIRLKLFLRGRRIKYLDRAPKNEGHWLIHGHVHGNSWNVKDKMINVSANMNNYMPVSIKKIEKIIMSANY